MEQLSLARHAAPDVADTAPRVQPRAESREHWHVGVEARRFQRDEEQADEAVSHGRRVLASSAGF